MAKMICAVKHFGKGGKLVCVGDKAEGNPDGTYWVLEAELTKVDSGKTLQVATPKKQESKD